MTVSSGYLLQSTHSKPCTSKRKSYSHNHSYCKLLWTLDLQNGCSCSQYNRLLYKKNGSLFVSFLFWCVHAFAALPTRDSSLLVAPCPVGC